MTCQEFWNSEAAADSPHLEECPACGRAWARQAAIAERLREVSAEWRVVEAPEHVESRLVAAFHADRGMSGNPIAPPWMSVATWFSAAAALTLAALLLLHGREPKPVHRAAPHAIEYAAVESVPLGDDAGTEFIPLPNAAQLAADEERNLVRLEIPRSAVAALGLELPMEGNDETVEADVMLGPDGLARAIRFLD